ncbi:DciA family protein [Methylotenera sp. L2L1]|uniref:DciA family protein n=1 Tax=Methylotenera sp. L2L1 TaxID=1502770 RepID=UPI0005640F5A|nr:DciA family protein [Methylotenera sp. L2L1]
MQRFNTLLKQPELNELNQRTLESQAAQKLWAEIAPENMAQFSHISSIKNNQFTVYANNNAVAAKIKLLIPSLLIRLEKQGYEVTAIRVKVQAKSSPLPVPKSTKSLSPEAINQLHKLEVKLSGTTLGDSLAKLLKNAGK